METIESASIREFRPLLFLIPFDRVETLVSDVPVKERAHPLSIEFKVQALPRNCFDVIEIWS